VLVLVSWSAAVGVGHACGVCRRTSDIDNDSGIDIPSCLAGTTLVVAGLFAIGSIRLALNTRRIHVVGVDVEVDTDGSGNGNTNRLPSFLGGGKTLEGKLVVVTGANNGIGKETARLLAAQGATVAMLCRNASRANKAMQDIREHPSVLRNDTNNNTVGLIRKDQLVFVPIDLTDFGSIRQASKIIQQHLQLRSEKSQKPEFIDALVCNAGLMMGTQSTTKDGLETMMQANHLGHFLLMKLMLDGGMLKTKTKTTTTDNNNSNSNNSNRPNDEPSRVCLLTSSTYEFAASTSGFDFEDPYCSKGLRSYTLFGQYSMTKLANLLTAKELARRYNNGDNDNDNDNSALAVFAVHPGIVRTNVTSNMNWYWRLGNNAFGWIVASLSKTPEEGAYSTVQTVAAPLENLGYCWKKGSYVVNCKEHTDTHEYVQGPTGDRDAKRLWEWSEQQLELFEAKDAGEKKEQ